MTSTTTEAPVSTSTTTVVPLGRDQLRESLSAHLLSAGRDELLPTLCHLRVRLTGQSLKIISTDRYRMTITEQTVETDGPDFDILLHRNDAQRIVKMLPARLPKGRTSAPVFLSVSETTLKVDLFDASTAMTVTPERVMPYPNVERVISDKRVELSKIGFNPAYLADFAKMPRERNAPALLEFTGSGKPAVSDWEHHGVNYRHVIMAMRLAA